MKKLESRGAKIYLLLEENVEDRTYETFESFIRQLIDWNEDKKPFVKIASVAKDFESKLAHGQPSRICKASTLNSHCDKGELTNKSLATIICYLFYEFDDQKKIQEKLKTLFSSIQCGEGSDYFEWINDVIKENIKRKITADDQREKFHDEKQENQRTHESYKRKYQKDWAFAINKDWKFDSVMSLVRTQGDDTKDPLQEKILVNEITSFWNNERVKNGIKRKWFQRNKTIFAYIFGTLFASTWFGVTVIAIGFYKTKTLVKRRKVRRQRYAMFTFMILVLVGVQLIFVKGLLRPTVDFEERSFGVIVPKFNPDPP